MIVTTMPNPARSTRDGNEPMAFTGREFLRGAIFAVLSFALLFPLATLLPGVTETMSGGAPPQWKELFSYLLLTTGYSGLAASVFCAFVGAPLAYLLGRLLRYQSNVWLHRLAFFTLGLLSGAIGAYVVIMPLVATLNTASGTLILHTAVVASLSVGAGWDFTRARAIREDSHPRSPRVNEDEDTEDRAMEDELRNSISHDPSLSRGSTVA